MLSDAVTDLIRTYATLYQNQLLYLKVNHASHGSVGFTLHGILRACAFRFLRRHSHHSAKSTLISLCVAATLAVFHLRLSNERSKLTMTNLISSRTTTRLRQCRSGIGIILYAFLALFCSYNVAHAYSLQRPVSMSSRFGMRISGSFLPSHELMSNVSTRSHGLKISSRSSSLSMHMGHSHSHHHHEHSHTSTTPKRPIARTAIRILFAALLALTPRLVSLLSPKKNLSSHSIKGEAAAFILLSSLFAIADRIREQTNQLIQKGQKWRLSMLKHSTPLSADYFFKNENAADKVTFLGVIINLILSGGKVVAGVLCHSSALVADAGHSLSDLFSDFVTLWAVQVKYCRIIKHVSVITHRLISFFRVSRLEGFHPTMIIHMDMESLKVLDRCFCR